MKTTAELLQQKIKNSGAKTEKEYYEHYATENEFLNWYQQQDQPNYPKPSLTVDLIGLRWNSKIQHIQILLVKRNNHPYQYCWALPGGFVEENESINEAIIRETKEETHINIKETDQIAGLHNIIRLPAVSNPQRDPRMWVVTNPNIVLFNKSQFELTTPIADDDAKKAKWFNISFVNDKVKFDTKLKLAFDHYEIIQNAFAWLKQDFDHRRLPVVTNLLSTEITLPEMAKCFNQFEANINNPQNLSRLYPTQLIPTEQYFNAGQGRARRVYEVSK